MKAQQIPWYAKGGYGKLDKKVYYRRYGKLLVRKAAGSYNKIPTEKQEAMRIRFAAAHRFAQSIIADPVLKALYEQKGDNNHSAYTKAVSEYLKKDG